MSNRKSKAPPCPLAVLRVKGWSLRPAAKAAGVTAGHLHRVLRGERKSARLLTKIASLPTKEAQP